MRTWLLPLLLLLSACASRKPAFDRMDSCWHLDDGKLFCVSNLGKPYTPSQPQVTGLMCFPAVQFKKFAEACHQ